MLSYFPEGITYMLCKKPDANNHKNIIYEHIGRNNILAWAKNEKRDAKKAGIDSIITKQAKTIKRNI